MGDNIDLGLLKKCVTDQPAESKMHVVMMRAGSGGMSEPDRPPPRGIGGVEACSESTLAYSGPKSRHSSPTRALPRSHAGQRPHQPHLPEGVSASPPSPAELWNELGASSTRERSSLLGKAARKSPPSTGSLARAGTETEASQWGGAPQMS